MSTFKKKLSISAGSSLLYFIINLPYTYKFTSNILSKKLYIFDKGCPNNLGLIVHTLLFFTITYFIMSRSKINNLVKVKHSLYGTLIFYFLSSPPFYNILSLIFGINISSKEGCPKIFGIIIGSIIYCISLLGVMYLPE